MPHSTHTHVGVLQSSASTCVTPTTPLTTCTITCPNIGQHRPVKTNNAWPDETRLTSAMCAATLQAVRQAIDVRARLQRSLVHRSTRNNNSTQRPRACLPDPVSPLQLV